MTQSKIIQTLKNPHTANEADAELVSRHFTKCKARYNYSEPITSSHAYKCVAVDIQKSIKAEKEVSNV